MQPPTEPTPAGDSSGRRRAATRTSSTAATTATCSAPSPTPSTLRASSSRTPARTPGRSCSGRQPERTSIFGWLYVVATREAFRLCERERRHVHLEAMLPAGSWDAVIADAFSIDDILEAREALEILASLPDRQRADLTLLVAGFSYVEIAELTGGRTYTNVNKHLAKARARVRLARLSDRHGAPATGAKNRRRGSL